MPVKPDAPTDLALPGTAAFARLERRWGRINGDLNNQVSAWADLFDVLGWSVAREDPVAGGSLWLNSRARRELDRTGVPPRPREVAAHLDRCPHYLRPVAEAGLQCWAAPARGKRHSVRAAALSARENEVLGWLLQGKRAAEIALILGAGVRTVEKHTERIYRKLGVASRRKLIWKRAGGAGSP